MEKDSPRKRPRENETPSQRAKREKAAERQRRKRERDRAATGIPSAPMPFPPPPVHDAYPHPPPQDPYLHQQPPSHQHQPPQTPHDSELSPDEQARRERVRAAARERQRKHRQLVKQRKMRELGLDMGNDVMGPGPGPGSIAEEIHYRVNADGQYQQVMSHELHQQLLAQQAPQGAEPPFPPGPAHGGQTFATTLLLSFSCAPLLKQHLLRTLNMTNDELASLEPVIAEAWDRWDQARRGMPYSHSHPDFPPGAPSNPPYTYPPGAAPPATAEDFRTRFQRAVIVPAPFHAEFPPDAGAEYAATNGAAGPSGTDPDGDASVQGDAIDPHLGGGQSGKDDGMKTDA